MKITIMFTTQHVDIRGSNMMAIQTFCMRATFTIYMRDILMNMSFLSQIKTRSPALPDTPVAAMILTMCMALTADMRPCPTATTPTT